ncbi:lipocalin-like [Salvelinus fontinalis]|uniref:lipocalin-like n=1 Tax=Salvelinus fontinalis TaxID=8038 RepID=UPI002484DDA7|nr:lipocalin-like [Salvelinus fontinalis]
MTTMLLRALGALLCSLVVTAEVLPQGDFNLQGVAGKWYLIGFATNAQWFVSHRASMKMGTAMLTPTVEGDLDMAYASLNTDGSCWRMNHLAEKTNLPGKFIFKSQRWNNENDMRVVDVKYDEYALIHTIKTKGGVSTVLNKLYARGTDLSPDLLQKFKQFSLDTGILPENIAILPKNDECPAA